MKNYNSYKKVNSFWLLKISSESFLKGAKLIQNKDSKSTI